MNDSEKDEEPHQEMMNLASHQIPTHQGNRPREQLREEGLAHLCVQAETRDALQQERPERTEIDQAGQGVMPDTVYRFVVDHQDIYLDHLQYLFPLGFL